MWGALFGGGSMKKNLAKLTPLLVEAIPKAVASAKPTGPVCVTLVYYYDTHAPCTYLSLRTVSAACRAEIVATKAQEAPFCLWGLDGRAGDGGVDFPPEQPASKLDKEIARLFERVYRSLGSDDDKHMPPFREMLWQVATQLNALDWNDKIATTDDFVVTPADGSGYFGGDYDDVLRSIPADRLETLVARGYIPDEWRRYDAKAARAAYEAEEAEKARAQRERFKVDRKHKACPKCGKRLRTFTAKQCFSCGADWH